MGAPDEEFRASFARAREASNCSATLVDSSSRRRSRHHGRTRRGDENIAEVGVEIVSEHLADRERFEVLTNTLG
jgi:hypothetical protein